MGQWARVGPRPGWDPDRDGRQGPRGKGRVGDGWPPGNPLKVDRRRRDWHMEKPMSIGWIVALKPIN